MLTLPLVSVICTVYNHQDFVYDSLQSVLNQSYPRIELIIIDNCSQDNSVEVIEQILAGKTEVVFIRNRENVGLCKAFNQGLWLSSGDFLIDLSADDVLLPNRIEKQVAYFSGLSMEYAVVFTNAVIVNYKGEMLAYHYPINSAGKALKRPPEGTIYKEILREYFICTPTMMVRRNVLVDLDGYDERLSFEDFDFWVRSSIKYRYGYLDEVLTVKREVNDSLARQVVETGNWILRSTLEVCVKAKRLNTNSEEDKVLAARIKTFIRKCWYAQEYDLAFQFKSLLKSLDKVGFGTSLILMFCYFKIPVNKLYRIYLNYFYKKEVEKKECILLVT